MGFGKGKGFSPAVEVPTIELDAYLSTLHNRDITASHSIWSTARGGYGAAKGFFYQRPDNLLAAYTGLNVSYFITRAYIALDTGELPADKVVSAARLGLFVTDLGISDALVFVTKGLWDEPVVLDDWDLQTDETTDLGHKATGDMVVGRYNWIDLNDAGIAWINQRPLEINQYESYDWGKTAHFNLWDNIWWSQSFTPQTSHTITSVRLRMKRKGSPGMLYVNIKAADAAHKPTGPVLASGTINANTFTTALWGDWYLIDLGDGVALTAGTEYCVECHIVGGSSSNGVHWEGATTTLYPNGTGCVSSDTGSSWTPYPAYGLYFIEYETAPVGGTKFCLRMYGDNQDVSPSPGAEQGMVFYSAQKLDGGAPLLEMALT
ncbi:hypothetical protein ES708_21936 [subsurface metagenome]